MKKLLLIGFDNIDVNADVAKGISGADSFVSNMSELYNKSYAADVVVYNTETIRAVDALHLQAASENEHTIIIGVGGHRNNFIDKVTFEFFDTLKEVELFLKRRNICV
jgi:hypothetical protein